MVPPEPMVVWMEEIVAVHILHNLDENYSLNDFTEDAKDGYRPLILWQKMVIFLEQRDNLSQFVEIWKGGLLYREVYNVSNCWQNVINHELDNISINIVNPTGLAVLQPQYYLPYSIWMYTG